MDGHLDGSARGLERVSHGTRVAAEYVMNLTSAPPHRDPRSDASEMAQWSDWLLKHLWAGFLNGQGELNRVVERDCAPLGPDGIGTRAQSLARAADVLIEERIPESNGDRRTESLPERL